MILDRRPYYLVGLLTGVAIVAFFWFGPSQSAEEIVSEDIRTIANEPWSEVYVHQTEIPASGEAILRGVRPNGTPVVVQFVAATPYAADSAVRALSQKRLERQMAEIMMVPISWVRPEFRRHYAPDATHAGIAYFGGLQAITATAESMESPETE